MHTSVLTAVTCCAAGAGWMAAAAAVGAPCPRGKLRRQLSSLGVQRRQLLRQGPLQQHVDHALRRAPAVLHPEAARC